jgi:mRNA-degrading endonuclease RelE of RelBE toxin-antitoxin system
MGRYTVTWSEQAMAERRALRSFVRPVIEKAVSRLEEEAEHETLHRKRLSRQEGLPAEYPEPTWRLRVGQHRVLYSVEGQTVRVLRVILKRRRTLGESL